MAALRGLFEWSERDHSLREVVEVFQNQLPVLAIVSEGYSGRDGMHEFASDEVYFIFDIQKQDKVVAKAALNRYVSIPVDYPVPFQRIVNGKPTGSALSMSSIIDGEFRGERIRFKDDVHVPFKFGADDGSFDQFGEMEVIEKYSEKYLLCHSIVKHEIHPLVIGIPAYVPIRMEVAQGFVYDTRGDRFEWWIKDLAEISKNLESGHIAPRQEILIFHESPGGDYEYISPLKFTAHSYDTEDDLEEGKDIPTWQLPQSTLTRPTKKCYTVARNPIKVCIQPVALPQIPGPGARVPRQAFTKATRLGNLGPPQLHTQFTSRTVDRRGPMVAQSRSTATLPPKSNLSGTSVMSLPVPPPPPKTNTTRPTMLSVTPTKSNMTLPPKLCLTPSPKSSITLLPSSTRPNDTKLGRLLKPGRSLDEEDLCKDRQSRATPRSGPTIPKKPGNHETTPNHSADLRWKPGPKPVGSRTLEPLGTQSTNSHRPPSLYRSLSVSTSDWQSLEDVPENLDVSQLSVDGVSRCLELLNLHHFVAFFQRMMVDGRMLLELDRSTLVDDFGLSKLDAIRLTMFANKWRPNLKED